MWFYAAKLVWPYPADILLPALGRSTRTSVGNISFPLAAVALPVVLWFARRRIGRGPLAAVLIFAGVLFPALGFFNVYPFRFSYVADHFQYHASVALIAWAAAAMTLAARATGSGPKKSGDHRRRSSSCRIRAVDLPTNANL